MKYLALVLLSLLIVSCGPSINPALQQKINNFYGNSSSKSFTMSGSFSKPMPLKVGQWVLQGSNNEGKKSVNKISIVGQEQGGWIFEFYSLTESEENWNQMLIKGLETANETKNMDEIDIVWVKIKDKDGNVSSIDGMVLSLSKGMYKQTLSSLNLKLTSGSNGGTVTVPAGTFNGTYKAKAEVTVLGRKYTTDAWYHSDVPINGMVKAVSDDGKIVTELLDFGLTGATRSF
ncbi:MAG: hypothetical protein N2319_09430 [Candidatus Kapabacteria bacterium]|nr:hypothetical protein [Candidatus Kapabacteria bacterium]